MFASFVLWICERNHRLNGICYEVYKFKELEFQKPFNKSQRDTGLLD